MKRLSRPAFLFVKSLRVSQLQPKIFAVCVQNTFEQYWLCPRIDKYPLQVECAISIRFWLAATSKLAGKNPQKTKTKETIVLVLIPHIGLFSTITSNRFLFWRTDFKTPGRKVWAHGRGHILSIPFFGTSSAPPFFHSFPRFCDQFSPGFFRTTES